MKKYLLLLVAVIFYNSSLFGQDENYYEVEYTTIAEGDDSPFKNLQVVCFNKYFNMEQLPEKFISKYNLTDPQLFKKKMLVEIFFSDTEKQGLDKIEITGIKDNSWEIVVEYNIVNADSANDTSTKSPFIIVQIPKSHKEIRFIANGQELVKGEDVYIKD